VDVPSSGSISGSKSVSCSVSWADISSVNDSAQGRDQCDYVYPAGKLTISRHRALEVLSVEVGGVPCRDGVGSGVGSGVCCLCRLDEGTPVPLRLERVYGLFAVPFGYGRHPGMWF